MTSTTLNIPTGRKTDTLHYKAFDNHEKSTLIKNVVSSSLKPLHVKHEDAVVSLVQWLGQSKIITKLNYKLSSTRTLHDNQHQVIINFGLSEKYSNHFVLLRGLFEFHNIKEVKIVADRTTRTFNVAIEENTPSYIVDHFEIIFNSLVKEINFKTILRGIIKLEERIKSEQALAYEALRASV